MTFRAAAVENILGFPDRFRPKAEVVTLAQNFRSSQSILDSANALMADAPGERPTRWRPGPTTVAIAGFIAVSILLLLLGRLAVAHQAGSLARQEFEPGVKYPERRVNEILSACHRDYAALRRYLVENGFLDRADQDHDWVYWRSGGSVDV